MNVYFACAITGGRRDEAAYQAIVQSLLADGHEVPTASLASREVMALEAVVSAQEVYRRDMDWIRACDALVAEVSTPSHGVGYEVGYALALEKPVLCCYRQGAKVSKMILGNDHPHLTVRAYRKPEELADIVRRFLQTARDDNSPPN